MAGLGINTDIQTGMSEQLVSSNVYSLTPLIKQHAQTLRSVRVDVRQQKLFNRWLTGQVLAIYRNPKFSVLYMLKYTCSLSVLSCPYRQISSNL